MSGDLIRLKNRSKLVKGTLFAIIDMLLVAKSITLIRVVLYLFGAIAVAKMITEKFEKLKTDRRAEKASM